MKIALGSDHAGLHLKNEVIRHLSVKGYTLEDFGTYTENSCDYPDYAELVAKDVVKGNSDLGILICGTGIGISIAANKIEGIRAALCGDTFSAHASREHNDANVLALGARVIGTGLALDIVDTFLSAQFLHGRHQKRLEKISKLEGKK
ncbi:MAG: ribose 5-phosphate isomerase B [Clostridiaceae bacterium]